MHKIYDKVGHLDQKDQIFFGSRGCLEECYRLHRKLEEAFQIISGIQQPPRPCDPVESCKRYDRDCEEGEQELLNIATNIVKGLLGKDFVVAEKEKR